VDLMLVAVQHYKEVFDHWYSNASPGDAGQRVATTVSGSLAILIT